MKKKSIRCVCCWILCLCTVLLSGCGKSDEAAEYIEQGMEALEQGDFDGAVAALSKAQEHSPDDFGVQRAMGIVFYQEGDYPQAVICFSNALQVLGEGGKEAVREDILQYRADAQMKIGNSKAAADAAANFEDAAEDYSQLIALDNEQAEYYLLRGRAFAALGDIEGAVTDFRTVFSATGNLDYCEDIYATLKTYGATEAGMEFLNEILAAGPQGETDGGRYGRACLEMVIFRVENGQYKEGLSLIQENLTQTGDAVRKDLFYAEAVCYEQLLDFGTALEKFRAYRDSYGSDEALEHEIAFLETRVELP